MSAARVLAGSRRERYRATRRAYPDYPARYAWQSAEVWPSMAESEPESFALLSDLADAVAEQYDYSARVFGSVGRYSVTLTTEPDYAGNWTEPLTDYAGDWTNAPRGADSVALDDARTAYGRRAFPYWTTETPVSETRAALSRSGIARGETYRLAREWLRHNARLAREGSPAIVVRVRVSLAGVLLASAVMGAEYGLDSDSDAVAEYIAETARETLAECLADADDTAETLAAALGTHSLTNGDN